MKIGAQLYTLRTYTQSVRDFGRAMARVAAMGYDCVQLSAQGPIPPKRVRAIGDDNALQIVLTHSPEGRILNDTDALIDEHGLYGCRYVGLGFLPERYHSPDWLPHFAEDFEGPARKLKAAGMKLMLHHHALEFAHMPEGGTWMDCLLSLLPADLMGVTADTYWLQYGGVDAAAWLKRHADRVRCAHLKDWLPRGFEARMAPVGRGNMDFAGLLEILGQGKCEYALVEQDDCYGESPFDCLRESREYLKKLGY